MAKLSSGVTVEDCERMIAEWNAYATQYAAIGQTHKALRFQRLATQMRDIVATTDVEAPRKVIAVQDFINPPPPKRTPRVPPRRKPIDPSAI